VTSLETVAQEVEDRFGRRPSAATLDKFVERLRQLGLLHEEAAHGFGRPGRAGKFRGSLLYLRLTAFDPDRLLNRLVGRVRFCFSRGFVIATAALVAMASAIALTNSNDITRDFVGHRVEMVLVAWLIVFTVNVAHEFAHSLACNQALRGEVREMGLLLIYF
jgi:hypothetical protein